MFNLTINNKTINFEIEESNLYKEVFIEDCDLISDFLGENSVLIYRCLTMEQFYLFLRCLKSNIEPTDWRYSHGKEWHQVFPKKGSEYYE